MLELGEADAANHPVSLQTPGKNSLEKTADRINLQNGTACGPTARPTAVRSPANHFSAGNVGLPLRSFGQTVHRLHLHGNRGAEGRPECSGPCLRRTRSTRYWQSADVPRMKTSPYARRACPGSL